MSAVDIKFFDKRLIDTEYFRRHRKEYERCLREGFGNRERCYPKLLQKLQSIFEYNEQDGRYFARRILSYGNDIRSCEAVTSEVVVYAHYLSLVHAGLVKAIDRREDDYDLRIQREGYSDVFLEIMCIMPEFPRTRFGAYQVNSHKQTGGASIRQKLLSKLKRQKQMQKDRENWAVIELNDVSIAGEFTVRSSLSDGYKLRIGCESNKILGRGYDWSNSIFDEPETCRLHGVIDFDLGYYEDRRYIINVPVHGELQEQSVRIP